MKRYNKIIFKGLFLAGLIGLFSSCEDFLTRDKPNASTDNDFWKTQQECESALGTCKLWLRGDWGGDEIGMVFRMERQTTFILQETLTCVSSSWEMVL